MAANDPVRIVHNGQLVSDTNPLPVSTSGGEAGATEAKQNVGNASLAAIETAVEILDNAIAGTEMQVDVLTQPDNRESWRVVLVADVTVDDSDKTLTVPATTEYEILSLYITLASTATVGNRQIVILFLSAADVVIGEVKAGVTQAASLTYKYVCNPGVDNATALWSTDTVFMRLPHMILAAGQKVRVYDSAAIAAAADDLTIQMQVASRSVA